MKLEPAKPIPKKSVLHQQVTTLGGLGLGKKSQKSNSSETQKLT